MNTVLAAGPVGKKRADLPQDLPVSAQSSSAVQASSGYDLQVGDAAFEKRTWRAARRSGLVSLPKSRS